MARPKKDNADYFSHDSSMRNDPKIRALRRKFGHSGYAVYCYMLEVLTDSKFFKAQWNELNIELLAGDFDITPEELILITDYCINTLKLFSVENDLIECKTLTKRFDSLLSKRKRDSTRVIASENPQSKVKESKVNKSKEDESIVIDINQSILDTIVPPETKRQRWELIKTELDNSETWLNDITAFYKSKIETTKPKLEEFIKIQEIDGNINKTFNEYKSYFRNWLRLNIDKPIENKEETPEERKKRICGLT